MVDIIENEVWFFVTKARLPVEKISSSGTLHGGNHKIVVLYKSFNNRPEISALRIEGWDQRTSMDLLPLSFQNSLLCPRT
jgi:hypothetical protein